MQATVYKSTGSWYQVKTETGLFASVRLAGKFKIDGLSTSNPVAVGDWVTVAGIDHVDTAIITEIHKRKNHVVRVSPQRKKQHHIIAANLDQSVLIATYKEPKTSTGFIDRFLITCEAYHIPAVLVFNKTDLLTAADHEALEQCLERYRAIGYRSFGISVHEKKGIDVLLDILHDKTTLLSGHSGVGKSTLINTLFPDFALRTGAVSAWSGKGLHTTTFAEMFDLPEGGAVIDTPGIRELGLVDIAREELSHYFPEMRDRMNDCQFNNCMHINEPGCSIKKAMARDDDSISIERYQSYLNMLDSIDPVSY
jgi:ribosome biogenesis GTPase